MKAFYKATKFTNQHGVLVGFFCEGDTQKEADNNFAADFVEAFEYLQTLKEKNTCLKQKQLIKSITSGCSPNRSTTSETGLPKPTPQT